MSKVPAEDFIHKLLILAFNHCGNRAAHRRRNIQGTQIILVATFRQLAFWRVLDKWSFLTDKFFAFITGNAILELVELIFDQIFVDYICVLLQLYQEFVVRNGFSHDRHLFLIVAISVNHLLHGYVGFI